MWPQVSSWGESFCLLYYTGPKLLFLNEFQLSALYMLDKFRTITEAAQQIPDQVTDTENAPIALHFSKFCHMSDIRNSQVQLIKMFYCKSVKHLRKTDYLANIDFNRGL